MQRSAPFTLVLASLLVGCSALIEPDPSRLGGGADGGDATDHGDAGVQPDGAPMCPPSCDDDVACTADACEDGRCTHAPNDAACGDGERCNPVLDCVPLRCTRDEECSDGMYCNGEERCDPSTEGTGCVSGTPPDCADGASCTTDRCDEDADRCVYEPDHAACTDPFACTADTCDPAASDDKSGCAHAPDDSLCAADFCATGGTCDPTSGCVGGGAPRDCQDGDACTSDTCDSSARMCVNSPRDDDGDGAAAARVPGPGGSVSCGGTDCDDGDASVHPGATEVCDGVDNDCNGVADEGCAGPPPDDCATAQEIPVSGAGVVTVDGLIESFSSDYETNPVCAARSGARDAVYYVDLPTGTWDVTIDTIGSAIDTVLGVGVGNACNASTLQHICSDDYDNRSGTDSRVWVHRVASGAFGGGRTRLYVLVDTYDATTTSGRFQLNVRLASARADSCPSSATGLAFDMSGGGSLLGFQSGWVGSERGSCQGTFDSSGEAVLFVRGPASETVDFEVYSYEFVPDIYLRRGPCGTGFELDCDTGSSLGGGLSQASIRESVTEGDAYFLVVDGGRTTYAVFYEPF